MTKYSDAEIQKLVDRVMVEVEREIAQRKRANENPDPVPTQRKPADEQSKSRASLRVSAKSAQTEDSQAASAPCGYLAPLIDHTILKPEATKDELRQVCDEARRFGFRTVCVNTANVRFVKECLLGSPVKAIAVVGFPLGASTPDAKKFETHEAIRDGAEEIDMVINIGELKSKEYALVLDDIRAVVAAAGKIPVKVIIETSKLSRDEKVIACALAKAAGAAFVKTSTGFGGGGATEEDVALMRAVVGDDVGVKASGGIRTFDDAERMVEAGATRIGASSSVAIVRCEPSKKDAAADKKAKLY